MQRKFYEKINTLTNNQIGSNLPSFGTIHVAFCLRTEVLEASLQQHCWHYTDIVRSGIEMQRQCGRVHRAATGVSPPWLILCSSHNNYVLELRYVVSSFIIHVKVSDVGEGCLVFGSLNVDWVGAQFVATHVCGGCRRRTARQHGGQGGTSNGTN